MDALAIFSRQRQLGGAIMQHHDTASQHIHNPPVFPYRHTVISIMSSFVKGPVPSYPTTLHYHRFPLISTISIHRLPPRHPQSLKNPPLILPLHLHPLCDFSPVLSPDHIAIQAALIQSHPFFARQ